MRIGLHCLRLYCSSPALHLVTPPQSIKSYAASQYEEVSRGAPTRSTTPHVT